MAYTIDTKGWDVTKLPRIWVRLLAVRFFCAFVDFIHLLTDPLVSLGFSLNSYNQPLLMAVV